VGRKLGRGLDELLEDNDVDLPFLSAYGDAAEGHLEGITPSTGSDDVEELLAAMNRHIAGEIKGLSLSKKKEGVLLEMKNAEVLPLVPSDLQLPGFSKGKLSADRLTASVVINSWGIEVRRLLDRLAEFVLL
jgi:hypothetical protein